MFGLLLSLSCVWLVASSEVNHCSSHHLPGVDQASSSQLVFTKELADNEYSVASHFKSLHCCAAGYLSIEWFKDDKAYPWPGDVSSFILYPESANQTVYTTSLRGSDAGNYTCRLHNKTAAVEHTVELKVFDEASGYMEKPLATYKPPAISYAAVGSVTRLFCEAFVGHIDLPDAASEVTWEKKGNKSLETPRVEPLLVQRESEIVGKYLLIRNVEPTDFGTYYCTISNTGDQNIKIETELKPLPEEDSGLCITTQVTIILLVISAPVAATLIYALVKSAITNKVWNKASELKLGRSEKKTGIVILFSEADEGFVHGHLQDAANKDQSVCLYLHKIKSNERTEETMSLCTRIGKIVIVLSRGLVPQWSRAGIEEALDKLILPEKLYSLILMEALPEALAVPKKQLNVFDKSDPMLWSKLKTVNSEESKRLRRPLARLSSHLSSSSKVVEVHV